MITFEPAGFSERQKEYHNYAAGLRLVDSYWGSNILYGRIYTIRVDGTYAGCCSILEAEHALTSFFLTEAAIPHSQHIFAELFRQLCPHCAYVVTGDELFLSLCMDVHKRVEAQGYFFEPTDQEISVPCWPVDQVVPAVEADLPELVKTNFYHPCDIHDPENPIFVLRDRDGGFIGTGHIALWMGRFGRNWGCIGMYTAPQYRGRGAGRSIILAMKQRTEEMGLVPICGCFTHNFASKATLESCGFVTRTRYLKVLF